MTKPKKAPLEMNESYVLPPSPLVNVKKAIFQKLQVLRLQLEKDQNGIEIKHAVKDDPTVAFAEVKVTLGIAPAFVLIEIKSNNILDPDKARSQLVNPAYEMHVGFFPDSEPATRAEKEVYYGSLPDIEQLYVYCIDYLKSNYMLSQGRRAMETPKPKSQRFKRTHS